MAITAVVFGAACGGFARRLPGWGIPVGLVFALGVISTVVLASHRADTPYVLFYIWVGADAWFFLGPRMAAAMTVATAACSAAVMAIAGHAQIGASWWLMVFATLMAVCGLTAVLRLRVEGLMAGLQADAAHDALTRVLNRRGYAERIGAEVSRALRHETQVSVVVADLDRFKQVNDTFGHGAGDEALKRFADLCVDQVRGMDAVCRIGGEEFALILPGATADAAMSLAERIRRSTTTALRAPDGSRLSASFGVATYPEHGADAATLLERADQAMYAAKQAGRDRTVVYSDGADGIHQITIGASSAPCSADGRAAAR
jgi:diguanylate cyclase (GGDEF)-like protein